jgi:mRNA interferase RelE/StbE
MKRQCGALGTVVTYRIEWKRSALREFKKLPQAIQTIVQQAVEKLRNDPRSGGCRKLAGFDSVYRVRIGDYRLVYEVQDKAILVYILRVRLRREAYREK